MYGNDTETVPVEALFATTTLALPAMLSPTFLDEDGTSIAIPCVIDMPESITSVASTPETDEILIALLPLVPLTFIPLRLISYATCDPLLRMLMAYVAGVSMTVSDKFKQPDMAVLTETASEFPAKSTHPLLDAFGSPMPYILQLLKSCSKDLSSLPNTVGQFGLFGTKSICALGAPLQCPANTNPCMYPLYELCSQFP
ncbi:hypothetical protein DLS11_26105 [Escherichia coli]|nr:hypothetical protein [Escherichia coli]